MFEQPGRRAGRIVGRIIRNREPTGVPARAARVGWCSDRVQRSLLPTAKMSELELLTFVGATRPLVVVCHASCLSGSLHRSLRLPVLYLRGADTWGRPDLLVHDRCISLLLVQKVGCVIGDA